MLKRIYHKGNKEKQGTQGLIQRIFSYYSKDLAQRKQRNARDTKHILI